MMKLPRRQFLHLAAGAVALPAVSRMASAQVYPTRPVRIVVGFAPAGPSDIVARLIGQWLSERLGQQFVIDNRPGAGGNIGTEAVVRSPADGYTLLLCGVFNAINATLYDKLNFNFIRDIAPVAGVLRGPYVIVVNPSVPAKSVPEFIAYVKANPRKLNMASGGTGTGGHIAGELFKMMAGVDMVHVPYRGGGPAYNDLLGGQVQVIFATTVGSIGYIRAGRLRALAVTTAERSPLLPDVPTIAESGYPGFDSSAWFTVLVSRATPQHIRDELEKSIVAVLTAPDAAGRLRAAGVEATADGAAELTHRIETETRLWREVVSRANIQIE
jgi:tripartite-type tricarboxylate transporter receptor subunit TctC